MLLEVEDLVVGYPRPKQLLRRRRDDVNAVNGVSFTIQEGETLGLVGESGSGKSSTGNAVLGLTRPATGLIRYDGSELTGHRHYPRPIRRNIQAVFQNPGSSLDPSMLVGQILAEPLDIHQHHDKAERRELITRTLELVGMSAEHVERSPHEFSGGQRQRIAIARALILEPRLLVLDEAVSALDASTQSQIINLLNDLQDRLGLAYLFISHDLGVVHHLSDHIALMYGGMLVERGPADTVFDRPAHPYTQALLEAVPQLRPGRKRQAADGTHAGSREAQRSSASPVGCPYQFRCPHVHQRCRAERPPEVEVEPSKWVACFLYADGDQ